MAICGTFQKLRPLNLLTHLSSCYDTAHLKVSSNSVSWSIYLEQGKIIYASHSVDPFDRLDCHLRRLGHKIPTLKNERGQLRLLFDTDPENYATQNTDYQAICWLVNQQYLNGVEAATLIEGLVKEVLESFLLIKEGTYEFKEKLNAQPFCNLEFLPIVEHCQKRLHGWQALGPQIWSPYQRPYFNNRSKIELQILPEVQRRLSAILKGFSFRHLAILLNQDELQLAQSLHPYVVDKTILLSEPQPPFQQLPRTFEQLLNLDSPESIPKSVVVTSNTDTDKTTNLSRRSPNTQLPEIPTRTSESSPNTQGGIAGNPVPITTETTPRRGSTPAAPSTKNTYKIVCVDDSPTILKEISHFLDDESFSVFTIKDSIKALMQIVRLKPDLVLLDVNMAGIDGYELCRLLRNHSLFKNTPIVMVTGNTGIIDRVKAKFVGASGYLTKPFTQSELLKMVFRHLS
jgi:twitching motility two-component system response regulator PilG